MRKPGCNQVVLVNTDQLSVSNCSRAQTFLTEHRENLFLIRLLMCAEWRITCIKETSISKYFRGLFNISSPISIKRCYTRHLVIKGSMFGIINLKWFKLKSAMQFYSTKHMFFISSFHKWMLMFLESLIKFSENDVAFDKSNFGHNCTLIFLPYYMAKICTYLPNIFRHNYCHCKLLITFIYHNYHYLIGGLYTCTAVVFTFI